MKRLGWKVTGVVAGVLLMGSGIVLVAHESSIDSTHEASSNIPYEPQILKYGLKNLIYLKRELPDLHAEVTSPDWMEMGGSDKLRLVVNSMTNVWGATDEDIDDYLSRIDQYESNVPVGKKGDVELIFGLLGEHLLIQFFLIEKHKETIQPLVDVYSILWEDDEPSKLTDYERCLDQTIVAMGANTKKTFAGWLDDIEEISASADMFDPLAKLHSKTASELVSWVTTEYSETQDKCNPDWEADS